MFYFNDISKLPVLLHHLVIVKVDSSDYFFCLFVSLLRLKYKTDIEDIGYYYFYLERMRGLRIVDQN